MKDAPATTVTTKTGVGSAWHRQARWRIAILLCLATTINHIDRQSLSLAAPVLMETFRLSGAQFGWINSSFLLSYAAGQIGAGLLTDRLGTKRSLSLAVVGWSLAAMLHAAGRGFASFLGLRALLGLTEAANLPAAFKAVGEWFPKSERGLASGVVLAGTGLGAMLAPPLIGLLIHYRGWQAAFLIPGAVGLLWAIAWQRHYHLPEKHPRLSRDEFELIVSDRQPQAAESAPPAWHSFLRYRQVWGLLLARFVSDGGYYFFTFWLPTYLSRERGFDVLKIALFAWIPFLAADLGTLGGGWVGKRLIERGASLDRARKLVIWAGALIVLAVMPAVYADSATTAILLIAVAMFGIQFKSSSLFALPTDLFTSRDVATVWGLSGAMGSFGAMLFQPLIGWLADNFSYIPVFIAVPLLQVLAALAVSLLIPRVDLLTTKSS
jgi:ACS family hexuronate transporter-like MFS transporter